MTHATNDTDRTKTTAADAFDHLTQGLRNANDIAIELSLAICAIPHSRPRCRIRARQEQHRYYSEIMSNERPIY